VTEVTTPPPACRGQLAAGARDTWLIFHRQMLIYLRRRVRIVFSFAYPVTMLVCFAPMMTNVLSSVGVTSHVQAYRIYVPGLLAYIVAIGGLATGFALLADVKSGIIERSLVTPVSRLALILGRALHEVAVLVTQAVIVTVIALPAGVFVRLPDLVLAYVLLASIGLLTVSLSYVAAMRVRNSIVLRWLLDSGAQPVMLVSGMLLPLTLAPLWIVAIARENPFYWGTNGVRALFADHIADTTVWVSLLVVLAAGMLATIWSARMFARDTR
jgi:ABC-2 type transport system permease protein